MNLETKLILLRVFCIWVISYGFIYKDEMKNKIERHFRNYEGFPFEPDFDSFELIFGFILSPVIFFMLTIMNLKDLFVSVVLYCSKRGWILTEADKQLLKQQLYFENLSRIGKLNKK